MSKESIGGVRWRHVYQSDYRDWCIGCGLHAHVNRGVHRPDCTRTRTEQANP